ncbi:hypothetical protein IW262DRAFT_1022691 [Armillaria fumosa]|nr:hypothetical protein IW262DRAFT_1022691 [Armillaria fumosa]
MHGPMKPFTIPLSHYHHIVEASRHYGFCGMPTFVRHSLLVQICLSAISFPLYSFFRFLKTPLFLRKKRCFLCSTRGDHSVFPVLFLHLEGYGNQIVFRLFCVLILLLEAQMKRRNILRSCFIHGENVLTPRVMVTFDHDEKKR